MTKESALDKHWRELMFLCDRESSYRSSGSHPKLLQLVSAQIDDLARQMGFSERQIVTRDFRAERDGSHIVDVRRDRG